MEILPIWMIRHDLERLPRFDLPPGFSFRAYAPGDEQAWAEIHTEAGQFETIEDALARFRNDFGACLDELRDRCLFAAEDETGEAVGSAVAWRTADFLGEPCGHLHWVSVRPAYQGRGIGRALVSRAMRRLAESHENAYLKTKSFRLRAIGIYLDFGFEPVLIEPTCERAWRGVAEALRHPALAGF